MLAALIAFLAFASIATGCGERDPYEPYCDESGVCFTEGDLRREAQAQAAYNCMPGSVQRRYDSLLHENAELLEDLYEDAGDDVPQAEIEATLESSARGRRISGELDALRDEYLPVIGEECD